MFSQAFGRGLRLCLDPIENGWIICVRKEGGRDDLARLTPPFHFINARYIEGWHFRNADNTGPNECGPLNVNAPQELREFIFSPHVTRETPLTHEEVERTSAFGTGELEILDRELSPTAKGERARMLAMEFEVRLRWR